MLLEHRTLIKNKVIPFLFSDVYIIDTRYRDRNIFSDISTMIDREMSKKIID